MSTLQQVFQTIAKDSFQNPDYFSHENKNFVITYDTNYCYMFLICDLDPTRKYLVYLRKYNGPIVHEIKNFL